MFLLVIVFDFPGSQFFVENLAPPLQNPGSAYGL